MKNSYEFQGMKVEESILIGINGYVNDHRPTGSFLSAVLSNDLKMTFALADAGNMKTMAAIMAYCYNEIPADCWGSPKKVKAWLEEEKK